MTTAITPQAPGGALEDYSELDGFDLPSDGADDIQPEFPVLRLVQGTSKMEGANRHGGDYHRSDTGEFLRNPEVVILQAHKNRALFGAGSELPLCSSPDNIAPRPGGRVWQEGEYTPRGVGAVPLQLPHGEPASCATCVLGQFIGGKAPYCSEGYLTLMDAACNPDDPDFVKFQASKTALKPLRQFFGAIKAARLPGRRGLGAPAYAFKVKLTSKEMSEGGNKWNQFGLEKQMLPPATTLAYASLIKGIMGQWQAEATAEPVAHDEPTPEAAPGWGDGTEEFGGV